MHTASRAQCSLTWKLSVALRVTDSVTLALGCTETAWWMEKSWNSTASSDAAQPLCVARASQAHTRYAVACAQRRAGVLQSAAAWGWRNHH